MRMRLCSIVKRQLADKKANIFDLKLKENNISSQLLNRIDDAPLRQPFSWQPLMHTSTKSELASRLR